MKIPLSIRYGGYILIGLGSLAAYAMFPMVKRAFIEAEWETARCTIESARMISDQFGTDSLELKYHYSVAAKAYQGSEYESKSNISRDERFFREALLELFPGNELECFYDPENPGNVVIKRKTYQDCLLLIVPAVFIVLGFFAFWFNSRNNEI